MSDLVVDSGVVAKWILPEADSANAHQVIVQTAATGVRLIVLDLVFPEVGQCDLEAVSSSSSALTRHGNC